MRLVEGETDRRQPTQADTIERDLLRRQCVQHRLQVEQHRFDANFAHIALRLAGSSQVEPYDCAVLRQLPVRSQAHQARTAAN